MKRITNFYRINLGFGKGSIPKTEEVYINESNISSIQKGEDVRIVFMKNGQQFYCCKQDIDNSWLFKKYK